MANLSDAMNQVFGGDDYVRALLQGGVSPVTTWLLGATSVIEVQ